MTYVNGSAVSILKALKAPHYPFPRVADLERAFSWCVTDYYTKASIGKKFEARGLLVTGQSRIGKTTEIEHVLSKFHEANELMPDGRPGRIVHCLLSRKVSWKDLGVKVCEALNYPMDGRRKQSYIWATAVEQARLNGVIGIHFDECQHVFNEGAKQTNRIFLDSFKTLLKDPQWPLILILSGVPELQNYVNEEEQLAHLLRPVHFDVIRLPYDLEGVNELAYAFAAPSDINFDPLSNEDFLRRLVFACASRWGLVIELIIEAFTRCRLSGGTVCTVQHFVEAFADIHRLPVGLSPFTASDYEQLFDPEKLIEKSKKKL